MTFTILLAYSQFKAKLYHVHLHEHNMLGHCEKTDGKIYNHSIMTGIIASQLKVSKSRPVSKYTMYILMILLANAFDTETNPGPRSPTWPCGTCNKAVTWKQRAICCDSCETWFHIKGQHIQSNIFRFMDASNISWECLQCGMPNCSTSLFNSSYSFETENQFSSLSKCLDLSSPGIPNATSSPKYDLNNCKNKPKNKTQKSKVKRPIRILNINFQFICNKKTRIARNYRFSKTRHN